MPRITDEIIEICNEFCDNYCKYPEHYLAQYKDPDKAFDVLIEEICEKCPLYRL